MSSRGSKSDGKGSRASGKSDRQKAKGENVVDVVHDDAENGDVVVVDEPEKTVHGHNCKSCGGPDSDQMVQCDACDGWHHYECVGVTDEVVEHSWSCANCKTASWIQLTTSTSAKDSAPKDVNKERSLKGASSQKDISIAGAAVQHSGNSRVLMPSEHTVVSAINQRNNVSQPNRGMLRKASGKLLAPSQVRLPVIQVEKASSEVSCSSSQRSARNRAKLQLQRLEEEKVFEEQQAERRRLSEQQEAEKHRAFLDKKYRILEELASESGSSRCSSSEYARSRVEEWVGDRQNARVVRKSYEQPAQQEQGQHVQLPARQELIQRQQPPVRKSTSFNPNVQPQSTQIQPAPIRVSRTLANSTVLDDKFPTHVDQPDDYDPFQLTRSQVAARQAVSKDLPTFSGSPEEWPIFLSMYNSTTAMCGFTEEENLVRLQRSLKGKAYEAIKCRLMHPGNVQGIMSTLRMLYGQPEVIIHSLIGKVSSLPPICEDRLETLVDFAVSVQNFCATVESCGLEEYMYNVTLLHQLVGKLPSTIKLSWAQHRKAQLSVNLTTFSEWIYSLAEAASSVTFPAESLQPKSTRNDTRRKGKGEAYLNAHAETPMKFDVNTESSAKSAKASAVTAKETCVVCKGTCKSVDKCKRFQTFSRDSKWSVVREFRLCRTCLRQHKGSCKAKPCGKNGCPFRHHELLHNEQVNQQSTSVTAENPQSSQSMASGGEHDCNTHQTVSSAVLFRYLPVVLSGPEKAIHTFAFLDEGSGTTLLDQDLADELQLDGKPNPICLRWTGGTERCEKNSCSVHLQVAGQQAGAEKFTLEDVQTVNELLLPLQTLDIEELKRSYRYLEGLPISSYHNARPRILIGTKHAQLGLTLKSREGEFGEPIATKTRLGWTICGNLGSGIASSLFHYSFHVCSVNERANDDLHQAMKDYFAIDSLGVSSSKLLLSAEDERASTLLRSLTRFSGDRYETGLLWRYDNARLPDSRSMALRRHRCLEKRMAKDPHLTAVLKQKIADYTTKGYIRKLSKEEVLQLSNDMWFLPVFPVTNPNKPGKVRIVWDAAAIVYGVSLNSVLLKGPDLLCSLLDILLRFRMHLVAVTGDIREMFHQVGIRLEDQQYQCFYWTDDNGELEIYIMKVMTFGACCSPSSAQYVKNVNAERLKGDYPEACEAITKSHYVDDMLISVATEEEAIQVAKDVRHVHAKGGFEIRNWISNSRRVVDELQNENPDEERSLNLSTELSTEKVLGMWWNTSIDAFTYKIGWNRYDSELLKGGRRPTKREVLRVLMTIFDPLGLIAHFLAYLKVLLQDIWCSGVSWDEKIDHGSFEKWQKWLSVLPQVELLQIPRCFWLRYSIDTLDNIQLHTFVDAGQTGMAAACFLRFSQNGKFYCSLVTAKARVAPLKLTSIPRLELQAAVIGTRLSKTVFETLSTPITKRFYWTDSRDVLCWINSDHRRYSQFVGFRITEILESSEPRDWRYVPSKLNVADDATKWDGLPDLSSSSRWFQGPSFLKEDAERWPSAPIHNISTNTELLANLLVHHAPLEVVIWLQRFSSWKRIQRVMALVLRFVGNCRLTLQQKPINNGPLTHAELRATEALLISIAQREGYTDEIRLLQSQSKCSKGTAILLPKSSSLYKLLPWIDDRGIMRMKTRIAACQYATEDAKSPIILPRNHHITTLIIHHYHERYHHQNHETVINEIRQKYQIARLRSSYSKVRRTCQRCKNEQAVPNTPIMADLPPGRLAAFSRPFTHVGIDYFGPIEVVVGRRIEKRWGMLATCLTIRAVHIELVHSLSTDSCIMAVQNFVARRGQPRKIYSDRGTNFVGADRELQKLQASIDHEKLMREFSTGETEWVFNPPLAPHMGGSWERLIRTIKSNLIAVCTTKRLSDEVLRNLLIEIENVVNSRPLTHIPVDEDSGPALTPNHFLLGSSDGSKPLINSDQNGMILKQNLCTSQILANQYWRRWVTDYLPEITRRSKWFQHVKPIATGDIVVIVDPKSPRNCWPKGRIISTTTSRDGQTRSATVQTTTGVYERPVAKLAVLDVLRVEQ